MPPWCGSEMGSVAGSPLGELGCGDCGTQCQRLGDRGRPQKSPGRAQPRAAPAWGGEVWTGWAPGIS